MQTARAKAAFFLAMATTQRTRIQTRDRLALHQNRDGAVIADARHCLAMAKVWREVAEREEAAAARKAGSLESFLPVPASFGSEAARDSYVSAIGTAYLRAYHAQAPQSRLNAYCDALDSAKTAPVVSTRPRRLLNL